MVDGAGVAAEGYRAACGYAPAAGPGLYSWRSRRVVHLVEDVGPEEERAAYEREAFDPADRAAFDYQAAETPPPLGAAFTTACIAADLVDRYGARDGRDRVEAYSAAVGVMAWAIAEAL